MKTSALVWVAIRLERVAIRSGRVSGVDSSAEAYASDEPIARDTATLCLFDVIDGEGSHRDVARQSSPSHRGGPRS